MHARALLLALLVTGATGCIDLTHQDNPTLSFAPRESALFLAPGGTMGETLAASPTTVPLTWGWRQWLDGIAPPSWNSEPAAAPYVVLNATTTIVYEATRPVVSTGQRPELTVWWGVERSLVHHAFLPGPPVMQPGERFVATFELQLPAGGLVVSTGERITLQIGTYYTDDASASAMAVRLQDETESTRMDLVIQPIALPPTAEETPQEYRGAMEGGRCMSFDAITDRDMKQHTIGVPPDAAGLRIVLDRAAGTGPSDVDFSLVDAEGNVIARGQGPGAHEEITLREVNLAAAVFGTWTLNVYNCTPQASTYVATATLLRPLTR